MTLGYALKISEDTNALRNLSKEELQEINKTLTSTLNAKLRKGHYSKQANQVDKDLYTKYYSETGKTQHSMERTPGKVISEDEYIENIETMRDYLGEEVDERQFSKKTNKLLDKFDNIPANGSWDSTFHGISQPKGSAVHDYIYENFVGNESFDNINLPKIIMDAENGNQGAKELYEFYKANHMNRVYNK